MNQVRKKIVFVVTKSNLGGAQRYVFDLAVSLPRDRFDVAVAFGGTGTPGSAPGALSAMLGGAGIRTIFLPELGRDISIAADRAAYQALRGLFEKERPDVVHLNSSKAGGLGALAAKRAHVPRIIYTAHGWPFTERVSLPSRAMRFLLSWVTLLLCDSVICVSESDRRAIAWAPFAERKLFVIHNGIRPADAQVPAVLDRESARAALFSEEDMRQHDGEIWMLSIAELTENKNLFRSIEAIRMMNESRPPHFFYCIMGDGEQHEALAAFLKENHLEGSIRLMGFVPDSRRYLAAFDAMLMASLKEGLPYAILEAGSAGLAVVASAEGGIPEIIGHQETGLLIRDPRSVDGIVEELRRLRDNPDRAAFGSALRVRVDDTFSFTPMREKTTALYDDEPVMPADRGSSRSEDR